MYIKDLQIPGGLFAVHLCTVHEPDVNIRRDNRGQGEGDTDAEKVFVFDLVALAAQDADAGDIGRRADGGAVAAQRCTRQQAEVEPRSG